MDIIHLTRNDIKEIQKILDDDSSVNIFRLERYSGSELNMKYDTEVMGRDATVSIRIDNLDDW